MLGSVIIFYKFYRLLLKNLTISESKRENRKIETLLQYNLIIYCSLIANKQIVHLALYASSIRLPTIQHFYDNEIGLSNISVTMKSDYLTFLWQWNRTIQHFCDNEIGLSNISVTMKSDYLTFLWQWNRTIQMANLTISLNRTNNQTKQVSVRI